MKNLAKSSVFFAIAVVLGALFFTQTEAGAAFFLANNSLENAQEEPPVQRERVVSLPEENTIDNNTNIETNIDLNNSRGGMKGEKAAAGAMSFSATCYCLKGKTASGAMVRRGIVAADPRVLPLGTRIQVKGSSHSGTYLVADTGGVIKGRIIDIWVPSCAEAIKFGRRKVTVTVLGRGGKKKA